MSRGFTFLELLITISVLSILLAVAAPSFSSVSETVKMQRLATELNGFMIQAKSEAVMRNEELFVHFSFADDNPQSTGVWEINLKDASNNVLLFLDGSPFNNLTVSHRYSSQKIKFEKVRGRPSSGHIAFYPTLSSSNKIKVILSNPPGRIKVCGVGGPLYDYKAC
ncbi:Tfp pilus assembly protein FimT/FimU [Vibrio gallaecicus]|uniref:Type II secretion system protein H n=1 Tax=Vibrio gallaecicus TaxID=552386 RepID=A0ABV4NDK0_9VIBR